MANATKIPSIIFSQWGTPSSPNPRLAAPIDSDDTTIVVTTAPLDKDGAAITGDFLMNVKNSSSYVELIYVPAGGVSGVTFTGCVRGIRPTGTDYTTGSASFAASHEQDSPVGFAISAVYEIILRSWAQGGLASGGQSLVIGDGTAANATVKHLDNTGTVSFLRKNIATGKVQFSNDGTNWVNCDDVSASDLVKVSANDTTAGYLNGKLVAGTNTTLTENNDGNNETLQVNAAGTLASIVTNVTATATEVNRLSGISANVTAANLNTLTAGASSSGDALHSHSTPALSGVAYEAITAGDAVASLPIETQYFTPMVETDTAIGSSNTLRKRAMKVIPSRNITDLTAVLFRAKEAVNGATVGNMSFRIETDSASAPSGTLAHANASASFTQATLRTWTATYGTRTATLAGAVTLTAGTTYWLVWSMDATDAANYIQLGAADTYVGNYLTSTRLTYNLDTTSWGSSTTSSPLYFWTTPSVSFGAALCQTDDDFPARKFNFVGFAVASASANAACSYYYDSVPGLTIVAGSSYWLSATAGAITTTPPSVSAFNIGYAFTDSSGAKLLKISRGEKIFACGNTASSSTTQNVDNFFLTGFKPSEIELKYILIGVGSGADLYTIGDTIFGASGTSISTTRNFLVNAASGSLTATSHSISQSLSVGTAAGVYLLNTLSIQNITDMGFTIRNAFTASGGPASKTSYYTGVARG